MTEIYNETMGWWSLMHCCTIHLGLHVFLLVRWKTYLHCHSNQQGPGGCQPGSQRVIMFIQCMFWKSICLCSVWLFSSYWFRWWQSRLYWDRWMVKLLLYIAVLWPRAPNWPVPKECSYFLINISIMSLVYSVKTGCVLLLHHGVFSVIILMTLAV